DGQGVPDVTLNVSIIDWRYGIVAFIAGLVALLAVPWTMSGKGPSSGLAGMLAESGGGLSLARLQLFLWSLPTIGLLPSLSVPLVQFPPLDSSFAALLGLSGLTTIVSGVSNPPNPAPGGDAVNLRQAVEDWQGDLDFSRVQFLIITAVGVLVISASF